MYILLIGKFLENNMKNFKNSILGLLIFSLSAHSLPVWELYQIEVDEASKAPNILKATNEFLSSSTGKKFEGGLFLNQQVFNGREEATHDFAVLHKDLAAMEKWHAIAAPSMDWAKFIKSLNNNSDAYAEFLYTSIAFWGNRNANVGVWEFVPFRLNDDATPADVYAITDKFLNSDVFKKYNIPVFLNSQNYGGIDWTTHAYTVGHPSMAAMQSFQEDVGVSAAWAEYLSEMNKIVTFRGNSLVRGIGAWGDMTLADFANEIN